MKDEQFRILLVELCARRHKGIMDEGHDEGEAGIMVVSALLSAVYLALGSDVDRIESAFNDIIRRMRATSN